MKKKSYTVPCASRFRDDVLALAEKRQINVADLARSVVLMVPIETIRRAKDSGEPEREDREEVVLKSGQAAGRRVLRKPRLQIRMMPGYTPKEIRQALFIALSMESGAYELKLSKDIKAAQEKLQTGIRENEKANRETIERLETMVRVLSFEPLATGVMDYEGALYVMGFPPESHPQKRELRTRYRMLAGIYHPDNKLGDHARMSQLNSAMEMLDG